MAGANAAWWGWLGQRPRLRRLRDALVERVTIDTRALALMRIGLGLAVVCDALLRLSDAAALYADGGVLAPIEQPWQRTMFPLYAVFGQPEQVRVLLIITALAGTLVMAGVRTRLSMLLTWWLLGSLYWRNGWVLQDGDALLRQLMLIGCLLPCGARWSWDGRSRRGRGPPLRRVAGPATALLVFQMMHLYMSTGLIKMRFVHWWLGDGVAYGLQADHFVTPLGVWLRDSSIPLAPLSVWTILLEALGPLVWLLARPDSRLRAAVWLSFVALHLGIAATIHVGLFSFVCLAMLMFALPTRWLDGAERWLSRLRSRPLRLGRAVACLPQQRWRVVLSWLLLAYLPLAAAVNDIIQGAPATSAALGPALVPARWAELKLRWAVFSGPRKATGWYLIAATQQDGQRVDLIRGAPLSLARPANLLDVFPNQRWRKLWVNFRKGRARNLRRAYMRMLCKQHPEARDIELIYMKRDVRLDGVIPEAKKQRIAIRRCHPPAKKQPARPR